jgi:hypothetical protein
MMAWPERLGVEPTPIEFGLLGISQMEHTRRPCHGSSPVYFRLAENTVVVLSIHGRHGSKPMARSIVTPAPSLRYAVSSVFAAVGGW